jgi:NAD(P)-dependent dehydrogenase (short-subunit alcohol dehydrogenase family)
MPPSSSPVVVVTGASSGIGLSTARAFAGRGYRVVVASRSESRLADVTAQCRADGAADVLAVVTDVADERSVDALFDQVAARFGGLDVVAHVATPMAYGTLEALPSDVFTAVVDTAVHGSFYIARAALRIFRPQGRGTLVFVSSLLASIAAPEMGAYSTGKWGQAGLIRTLQLETRNARGIKICSVSPGGVNTPIYTQAANFTGRSARAPIPVDPPEKVARAIVHCVDKPKKRVSVGLANPLVIFGFRFFPQVYDALVTPLLHLASLSKPGSAPRTEGNVFKPASAGEAEHGPSSKRWKMRPS